MAEGLQIQLEEAQAGQSHKATYDAIAKSILAPTRKDAQYEATIKELRDQLKFSEREHQATKEVFEKREAKFQDKVAELVNFNDSL